MREPIAQRLRHAPHLFRPGWGWAMGVTGAVGTLQTLWPAIPDRFELAKYEIGVPQLPLWGWLLILAALAMGSMFEGSFRLARQLRTEAKERQLRVEELERALNADYGEMTLREVFDHIDPDTLDNKSWERIGDDLADRMRLGQIKVWGREMSPMGRLLSLGAIDADFWRRGGFNYTFFTADWGEIAMKDTFHPDTGGHAYYGLVFNRDQIAAIYTSPLCEGLARPSRPSTALERPL